MTGGVAVRAIADSDRSWVAARATELWGEDRVISRGKAHTLSLLPGFIAQVDGEPVGIVTYDPAGSHCEIVSINSWREGVGAGTALLEAVVHAARDAGCRRVWLITTNDNLRALRFYQKRGFRLQAVYPDAVTETRKVKPSIPELGFDGIPLRDEIELEMRLTS